MRSYDYLILSISDLILGFPQKVHKLQEMQKIFQIQFGSFECGFKYLILMFFFEKLLLENFTPLAGREMKLLCPILTLFDIACKIS